MSSTLLLLLAIAILPTFGVAAWSWLATKREIEAMHASPGLGGMFFED